MPVQDLDLAHDHPTKVLVEHYNASENVRLLRETVNPEVTILPPADDATVQDAINVLRKFEADQGVVFATLDKKAALDVQNLYDAGVNPTNVSEFISAVCDLLGLD